MRGFIVAALLAAPAVSLACGVCIEDKVAAVYDYELVSRALARGQHVAFFQLEGRVAPGEAAKHLLEDLAGSAAGVERGSARVSLDTMSLAVAYDPRRAPFARVQAALEKKFAARRLVLAPLKLIERPGELTAVAR